ncbi:MAG: FlgD immunoglobulin-like domain containing protein [Candidatus Krumholzibacteria bacterium]|nr:FlgD immunoglobulin-like domain containing protein [Candidatus Krumholzibacteria bacterium]
MQRWIRFAPMVLVVLFAVMLTPMTTTAKPLEFKPDRISAGAAALDLAPVRAPESMQLEGSPNGNLVEKTFVPGIGFLAYNFDDNAAENAGFLFIPPDPMGSAGLDRLIAVVNAGIECRTKTGTLLYRDSLKDFFSALGAQTLGTTCFDPKIVYDHYENRFLVVALERWFQASGDPSDESRILVAVSKTSSPATATAADWEYLAIDSKVNIGGFDHWADYPGFEVDEEAVYITNNMFPFSSGSRGTRLWIIDKGVGGGFYAGAAASWAIHNPIPAGYFDMTLAPALVYGAGGIGGGGSDIGTFLVGYNGLSVGGPGQPEALEVIRIDNPLGAPTFTGEFVFVGDLEDIGGVFGFPGIPDAPQNGTATLIEVNDSRTLDAVWRDNSLWVTTTISPNAANDPANVGQATAHWFRLNTGAVPGPVTVADQGNIGGDDIAQATWTFFPSVAVNGNGDAKFGFSASAQTIFPGAYYTGREVGDPAGTVQASGTVQAGTDYYIRDFGGSRNRWGDYSGASVDPVDDTTFWLYNEYAETRGTIISGEDGRWGTAWKSCTVSSTISALIFPIQSLNGPVSVYSTLDGTGNPLSAAQLWSGILGDPTIAVDATIGVRLIDGAGNPVVGFPPEKITVRSAFGGWTQCGTPVLMADAPTDVNGLTTISGALFAGGFSAPGEFMEVVVDSPLLTGTSYPGGLPGLEYWVNSGDMNNDLVVDLSDVVDFSGAFVSALYSGDFQWNGAVNLSDVTIFAASLGASCPGTKSNGAVLAGAGELGIVFDSPNGSAMRMIEPGQQIDAYVVLNGAAGDIEAFTAAIRTSGNVEIHRREIVGEGLNLSTGNDLVLGYAIPHRGDDQIALARLRISVTDEQPAYLWLEAGRGAAGSLPAVVRDGELMGVAPASGDVKAPVASLNDKDFDLGDRTPDLRNLSMHIAPNPFNPMTEIRFNLPATGAVELRIYDTSGKLVTTLTSEVMTAGEHTVVWNGTDRSGRTVASGVYFSTLRTDAGTLREKMLLMK